MLGHGDARTDEQMVDVGVLDLSLEDLERSAATIDEDRSMPVPSVPAGTASTDEAQLTAWLEQLSVAGEGPSTTEPSGDELFPDPEPLVSPYDDPFA
jgi:hypothetical protein